MQTATIAQQIRSFIQETFLFGQADNLRDGDSFLESGIIDSTGILQLIAFLQDAYGVRVEDEEAIPDNLDSIDRIVVYLRRKLDSAEAADGRGRI
jgi:acyl carrier protein